MYKYILSGWQFNLISTGTRVMTSRIMNVLFLCTGNSARSIFAEASLQRWGLGKFNAYSAGSMPKGRVNPLAAELLVRNNYDVSKFRSKSWEEFSGEGAPALDFVITVCDNAANEVCPIWPGQPMSAHWGVNDPDRPDLPVEQQRQLMKRAYMELDHRIRIFTALPFAKLEGLSLQRQLDEIGKFLPENLAD
jgi:arsenate reductase